MPVPTMENSDLPGQVTPGINENSIAAIASSNYQARDGGALPENMILMQVNPGETFTIQTEDGNVKNITGPAQVPMVSPTGAIPPIYVPPGYVSHVIEENGVRRVIVIPSSALGLDGPTGFINPHSMHVNMQPVHPGVFAPTIIQNCRPEFFQLPPRSPVYVTEDVHLPDISEPSHSHDQLPEMHPNGSYSTSAHSNDQHSKDSNEEASTNTLLATVASSGSCSVTASPSSSCTSSPGGNYEPGLLISANEHQAQKCSACVMPDVVPQTNFANSHLMAVPNFPTAFSTHQFPETFAPVPGSTVAQDDEQLKHDHFHSEANNATATSTQIYQTMTELLAATRKPEVLDIKPKSARVVWSQLPIHQVTSEVKQKLNEAAILFDLRLCNHRKDTGKFQSVYKGLEHKHVLHDLRPASDYSVKLYAIYNKQEGESSEVTSFRTPSCPPEAPQAPKSTNRTKNSILLKWTAPLDNGEKISKYHLEWDEGNLGSPFQPLFSNSQRQFKAVKLMPSHSYTFRLAAENKMGKSPWSPSVSFPTSGTVPGAPDAPRLTKAMVKSLTLAWAKPAGEVTGYTLEMNDESTGYGFRPEYDGVELKYVVKNLVRSTHYKFRLSAYNKEGKSKWSEVASYVTCPDKPQSPGKPHVKGGIHARFFRLIWDAPKDNGGSQISEYVMEMSKDKGRPMEVIYNGPDQECSVEELEPGHSYRLRVFCRTSGGTSMPSDVAMVTTPPVIPGQCDTPMLAFRPKSTCITIKWDPPSYAGGTTITCYEASCIPTAYVDTVEHSIAYKGPELSCVVGSLRPGTEYSFAVRAENKVGIGPWSNTLAVVTSPGSPDKPAIPDATVLSPTSVHLQWNAPESNGADITNYKLMWGGAQSSMLACLTGPVLVHPLQTLSPNTVYYYSLQAVNSIGHSPISEVGSVCTPPSAPDRVTGLRHAAVTDEGDSDVDLTRFMTTATSTAIEWNAPCDNGSEITSYKIHIMECSSRKLGSDSEDNLIESEGSGTYYRATNLSPDTDYSIKVCAVNNIGCGGFGSSLRLHTKPLPPDAPKLTCVQTATNSLKLKWGNGQSSVNSTQYLLQMHDKNGRFITIYRGSNFVHRVQKLNENTAYRFRINASNAVGAGHFSPTFSFATPPQIPPTAEAPVVSLVKATYCEVSWPRIEPIRGDSIQYRVCLEPTNPAVQPVDRTCEGACYTIEPLQPSTEYRFRVAAVRITSSLRDHHHDDSSSSEAGDDYNALQGPFSNSVSFVTPDGEPGEEGTVAEPRFIPRSEPVRLSEPEPVKTEKNTPVLVKPVAQTTSSPDAEQESLSDDKKAAIWLALYLLSAIIIAFALQFFYVK
ncbi:fibronectin type-III domain-containing protein 3a-like isoform X2 [Clavelina lepadiformis]|uniref:fibronectin type-III domain-containing protein 3a-like isoform X2 n=1 Tax=Clavelina lepadiformis TaxID=159417 RepID=UPI004040FD64